MLNLSNNEKQGIKNLYKPNPLKVFNKISKPNGESLYDTSDRKGLIEILESIDLP